MKILNVYNSLPWFSSARNLNMRQLLNPLFYDGAWPVARRHPDSKRQRRARQRALTLRRLRALKATPVPLCQVDPTVYLVEYNGWLDRDVVKAYDLRRMIGGRPCAK